MDDIILRLSIQVPGFLLAIVIHEWAHAFMAYKYGDSTAKDAGRLSFNPIVHLDIVGTVVFPLVGLLLGGIMFGWAKPVPVDARSFKNPKKAIFWVSFAGPLANIIMAILSAFLFSFLVAFVSMDFFLFTSFIQILQQSIYINIILAVFNLIPFPPLDGSRMVAVFMKYELVRKYEGLSRYSLIFFIVLMYTGALRYIFGPALFAVEMLKNVFYKILV